MELRNVVPPEPNSATFVPDEFGDVNEIISKPALPGIPPIQSCVVPPR
jgi:hypothetical protein